MSASETGLHPLERLAAPVAVDVARTPGSLTRVGVFALLFLALLGRVATPGDGWSAGDDEAWRVDMTAPFGDPRAFRGPTPERRADELRIAWVGGSSLLVHQTGTREKLFLPERVADALREAGAGEPRVLDYVLSAQRVFESWVCALDALRRDPDVVVVTLNPLFVHNAKAPLFRRFMLGAAAQRAPASLAAWREILTFGEPSDLAWAGLATALPVFRDRAVLGARFARASSLLRVHEPGEGPVAARLAEQRAKAGIARPEQPLIFWHETSERRLGLPALDWQEAALRRYHDTAPGSANDRLLTRLLETLRDAEVPSLVYLAPVAPEVETDPELRAALEATRARLATRAAALGAAHVRVVPAPPARAVAGAGFADLVHLKDDTGDLPAWLAGHLLELRRDARAGADPT